MTQTLQLTTAFMNRLRLEIEDELADPEYENCQHGLGAAYNKGCRGPLCRKHQRERQARYFREKHAVHEGRLRKPRRNVVLIDRAIKIILEEMSRA